VPAAAEVPAAPNVPPAPVPVGCIEPAAPVGMPPAPAAPPLVPAAALVPGSDITIHDVNLNPRRTGFLDVLERMGAHLAIFNRHKAGREQIGDVQIQYTELGAVEVNGNEVPLLVDELPLVALLASHARGKSFVRGAAELRVKETDRIEAVTDGLRSFGAHVTSKPDGWEINGVPTRLKGGRIDARGDHRIAMLGAVAKELGPLKLGEARFRVALTPVSEGAAGANGLERVAFEIATIEGAPFGPLTKIASGGELARVALALKVAVTSLTTIPISPR